MTIELSAKSMREFDSDREPEAVRSSAVSLPVLACVAMIVFVASWGSSRFTRFDGGIAAIWWANAIVLAFVLRHSTSSWSRILVVALAANVLANLISGFDWLSAGVLAVCNLVEILLVAGPLRLFGLDQEMSRPRSLLSLWGLSICLGAVASSLLASTYLYFSAAANFQMSFEVWYVADALGLVTIAPALLVIRGSELVDAVRPARIAVTSALILLMIATLAAMTLGAHYPIAFVVLPVILLFTFVRGLTGGAVGLLVACTYATLGIALRYGHLSQTPDGLRVKILIAQLFVATLSLTTLLIGGVLAEKRRLIFQLAQAKEQALSDRASAVVSKDLAQAANRAKSAFLANMSHELRTPLNAILGYSEIMRDKTLGVLTESRYSDFSSHIHAAGSHLLNLINDVLDMSKIDAGKMELHKEKLDCIDSIRECVTLMHVQANRAQIHLTVDAGDTPLWLTADRRSLKQILLNLISNAIKFTPVQGRVTIGAVWSGEIATLYVQDTGIGIPASEIARLGTPFAQVRETPATSHEGTGLGLALVRSLTELHGGSMFIESELGVGTKVSVSFPLEARQSVAA